MLSLPQPFRRLTLPVYVPTLLMSASQMALMIVLPLHVVELGYSAAFAAAVVGVRGIGLLLFDVPAGMIVARFGDKATLMCGLALIVSGNVLLALFDDVAGIWLAVLLNGGGFAAWMLGRQSYIADTCSSEETGRAIAVMAGLQRVGIFVGPAAAGLLAARYGFAVAFIAGAVLAGIAGLFVLVFTSNVAHAGRHESVSLSAMLGLVRSQAGILVTAGFGALSLQLMRSARQLLVPLFGQAAGLGVAEIGVIYSLSAGIDMSLFYVVGTIVDRHGRKWSAVPSLALFALGLALLPLVDGYRSLLAVGMLLGLANGLGTGIVMIIGADLARRTPQRGQFLGIWRLIGDTGMTAAPLLSGLLVVVASLSAASLSIAVVGAAGAIVVARFVPETLRRSESG